LRSAVFFIAIRTSSFKNGVSFGSTSESDSAPSRDGCADALAESEEAAETTGREDDAERGAMGPGRQNKSAPIAALPPTPTAPALSVSQFR